MTITKPRLSQPPEFQGPLSSACLPLDQEEVESTFDYNRTSVFKWLFPLGEIPEADECQRRSCASTHLLPSDLLPSVDDELLTRGDLHRPGVLLAAIPLQATGPPCR